MRLIHYFLELVAESVKSFLAVPCHGEVDFSFDVVQVEGDAAVFLPIPIRVDFLVFA